MVKPEPHLPSPPPRQLPLPLVPAPGPAPPWLPPALAPLPPTGYGPRSRRTTGSGRAQPS